MQEGAWMEGPVQVREPLCIRRERRAPQKRREIPDWKREQPIEEKLSTDWRAWCPPPHRLQGAGLHVGVGSPDWRGGLGTGWDRGGGIVTLPVPATGTPGT